MASKKINILMSLTDLFTAPMKKITDQTKEQEKAFKRAQNALGRYGASAGKQFAGTIKNAAMAATGALAGIVGYSTKVGSEFEAAMSKVQAISGASGASLQALTEKAKEMGATTQFSASEAAEAMQYMAMAGWKDADMLGGIKGIMDLAAASGESLASTSDIVTDALSAFGLQAKDSSRFADVLAAASSNANTNVALMGSTFKYVAPLAGALKYSVDDVAVAIGLMANQGIKGEMAGTALRSTFSRLVTPPKDAAEAMNALGISVKNADGTVKPLSQTMLELRKAFSGLSESQKAEYAASIAGKEAMSGFLALVNTSDADFNKLTEAIKKSDGAAANTAKTMNNNLAGQLKQFGSVTESIGINIYDKFKKPLTDAFGKVNDALSVLSKSIASGELSDSLNKLGDVIGNALVSGCNAVVKILPALIDMFGWMLNNGDAIISILAGVGAGMAAFKIYTVFTTLTAAIQGTVGVMGALNAVMAINPAVAVAMGVAALVAGIIYAYQNCETFRNILNGLWETFKGILGTIYEIASSPLEWIAKQFGSIGDKFKSFISRPIFGGGEQTPHNATGTSYFPGGPTYVNENNRGELINLPNGSQIIPHDLSVKTMNSKPPITINVNIAGNVIGNEEFVDYCGKRITERVMLALGNT